MLHKLRDLWNICFFITKMPQKSCCTCCRGATPKLLLTLMSVLFGFSGPFQKGFATSVQEVLGAYSFVTKVISEILCTGIRMKNKSSIQPVVWSRSCPYSPPKGSKQSRMTYFFTWPDQIPEKSKIRLKESYDSTVYSDQRITMAKCRKLGVTDGAKILVFDLLRVSSWSNHWFAHIFAWVRSSFTFSRFFPRRFRP